MKIDVKINLNQIAQNLKEYKNKVILMVKGDAYGHGLREVSKHVEPLVYGFGVATVEEGVALRQYGITKQILVCQCLPCEIEQAVRYNLIPTIGNFEALTCAERGGFAVKINTGMNRLGFDLDQLTELKSRLNGMQLRGVYSHVYSPSSKGEQCALFDKATDLLDTRCDKHIFASSTAPKKDGIVRVGIDAYKGAMTVESSVVAVRWLDRGDIVGYGNVMPESGNVAWIFGGYADGINRERPQPVLIGGKICPIVAVCMDTSCVYTGEYESKIGERAVLQDGVLTPEYIAEATDSIPYTILVGRKGRINRVYTQ